MEEKHTHPQRLEKIPPGFGLIGIIIRDRNNFCSRQKARNQQAASKRRAVKEDELPAELEQQGQGTRRGAGSATCSRWRTSGARSSSSGSLTGRCTWHSASSRTCAKIRQRRQHQGHRRMKLQDNVRAVVVKEVQLRNSVTRGISIMFAICDTDQLG